MESILWTTECYEKDSFVRKEKHLVPEIEYSLYVNEKFYSALSCSPWHLEDLAYGVLYGKGQIISCAIKEEVHEIYVTLEEDSAAVSVEGKKKEDKPCCVLMPGEIRKLSALLDEASGRFRLTGGVHSAAIADREQILLMREDVGRHNAMDKLLGTCLRENVDTSDKILLFSGRVAAEIIEKAAHIGCSAIIAVSAPTSRACHLAVEKGILLVGFARGERFNVYTFPERICGGDESL